MARFMWTVRPQHKKEHHHADSYKNVHEEHDDMTAGESMVETVLDNPPSTWEAYKGKVDGYWHIVDMEEGELANARAAVKGGTRTEKAVVKELSHVAAACINAIDCILKK